MVIILFLVGIYTDYWIQLLPGIGRWLVVERPLRQADLVVALGGDRERQKEAVRLFQEGQAQWILFVGPEVYRDDYTGLGVPPENSIYPLGSTYSIYEEAVVTHSIVQQQKIRSILLVTYPHNMRLALLVFEKVLKGNKVDVIVAAAPFNAFSIDEWWKSGEGWKVVFMEYAGLFFYRISL